jgi:hypothetical protein
MTLSNVVTDTSAFGDTFAAKRGGLMSGSFTATGVIQDGGSGNSPMPHADDPAAPTDANIAMSAAGTVRLMIRSGPVPLSYRRRHRHRPTLARLQ